MRGDRILVAPPEPRFMAGKREVAGGRKRTAASAEYGNSHSISPADAYPPDPLTTSSFQAELLQLAKHVVGWRPRHLPVRFAVAITTHLR